MDGYKAEQILFVKYRGMGVLPTGEKHKRACGTIFHPLFIYFPEYSGWLLSFRIVTKERFFYAEKFTS